MSRVASCVSGVLFFCFTCLHVPYRKAGAVSRVSN
jgi:hypothetical protein